MNVLIITYYWPPAGGSGVQRWLKFVKYLQDFDINPIVYTVDNPNYPIVDSSLENEIPQTVKVLRKAIWEPTDLLFFKKKNQQKKAISNVSKGGLLSFIRGNFFIPDPKIFWVKPSVKFIQKKLDLKTIDLVISTGPPHSMHLIAQQLCKKNNLKWIADFRDPWTNLYYNSTFKQGVLAKKKNKKLEQSVLKGADCVLAVSATLKKEFEAVSNNVQLITNGFDDEVLETKVTSLDSKFSIAYIGLLPAQSNPKLFFKVLKKMCLADESFSNDLKINFIGDIADVVKEEIEKNQLTKNTIFTGVVLHKKAIAAQQRAQVLLLCIPQVKHSKGIVTGKIFEYLAAKRPILAIGPTDGDLAEIVNTTNSGTVIDFDDEEKLEKTIANLYRAFKTENLLVASKNIEQYHRKKLTERLAKIIKETVLL